jgi:hypothetical protein
MSRPLVSLAVVATAAVLAACGDDEEPPADRLGPEPGHAAEVRRDPYAVTCGDLARQTVDPASARLVIHAEFALGRVPELRRQRARLTLNRTGRSVYYGMTEVCKGHPASFRPARAAVAGVRSGRYRAARNRPG